MNYMGGRGGEGEAEEGMKDVEEESEISLSRTNLCSDTP